MEEIGAQLFAIPPRSPDVNPIESLFHLVPNGLNAQVLSERITQENFIQFSAHVKNTFQNFPVHTINKIIKSMNTKMSMLIKCKCQRIKYWNGRGCFHTQSLRDTLQDWKNFPRSEIPGYGQPGAGYLNKN